MSQPHKICFARFFPQGASSNSLLLACCILLLIGGNATFFSNVLKIYPLAQHGFALASLALSVFAFNFVLIGLFAFGRLTKPVLIATLILASCAAYFMDSYGTIIGSEMIGNIAQTQTEETLDLLTPRLAAYVALLGLLPGIAVWRIPIRWSGWRTELVARARMIGLAILTMAIAGVTFGNFYASFLRTHKSLRGYVNPSYFLLAGANFLFREQVSVSANLAPLVQLAPDAYIPKEDEHRELFILVVGETARADRFSINGYGRETTPRLVEAQAISLTDFWSCGSSTAVSVPCMFSSTGMTGFDTKKFRQQENLLDVLQRTGVNVLWLDNNSDSKGVALRVPYRNYRNPATNPICDSECRDEGMLVSLQSYIDSHPQGDLFIVLHQMGNHGPAYYKRYPAEFEKFRPACRHSDLSRCTDEEIGNAYDNAILYTDYFLGKTIELLKRNDNRFETALFYLSDHGESLGEKGLYLHGMPRPIAPESQLHVPGILWFGRGFDELDLPALMRKRHQRFSHDHLFHTILGFLEVRTSIYRPDLDILDGCRKDES